MAKGPAFQPVLPKTARKTAVKLRPQRAEDIQTLLDFRLFFDIKNDWDGILVTDGSGTTWDRPIGWAGTLVQRIESQPEAFCGTMSRGTNNTAEILGVLGAALFLAENEFGQREHGYKLYVVSDSQYVVRGLNALGQGGEEGGPIWASRQSANRPLWLGLLGCQRKGLVFLARHVGRDILATNKFCHDLANAGRRAMIKLLDGLERPPTDWKT